MVELEPVLMWCSQVGDGTTSVVLIAGEILKNCKSFIEDNVHPQIIARGLRKATQLALTKIREIAVHVKNEDPKWAERRREEREGEREGEGERGCVILIMNMYVCVLKCVSLAVSECQRMHMCILSGHFDCFFCSPTSFFFSLPPPFFHNSRHLLIFICGLSYLWWDIELASPYFQSVIPHALPWQPNLPHSQKCVPFRICSLKYPPSTLLGLACLDCECVCVCWLALSGFHLGGALGCICPLPPEYQ